MIIIKNKQQHNTITIFKTGNIEEYTPNEIRVQKTKTITITENGKDVYFPSNGYNAFAEVEVEVNVPIPTFESESKNITITENGTTTVIPSEGYNGLSEVNISVDVPDTNGSYDEGYSDGETAGIAQGIEEQKAKLTSINITENGTYNREDGYNEVIVNVPDTNGSYDEGYSDGYGQGATDGYEDGYNLGKEDGTTAGIVQGIEEQKAKLTSINITENGIYNREDGYNEVTVNVPIPTYESESKNVTITENGTTTVIPSEGYDGLSEVVVNVDVPTSGGTGGDGYDFSVIGYTSTDSANVNNSIEDDIAYSKTLYDAWNPSNTSAAELYYNDSKLVYAPAIDTSNVTHMGYMFYGCSGLQYVPKYYAPTDAYKTSSMFYNCTSLKEVDLTGLNNVSLTYMFYECSNLENIKYNPSLFANSINSNYAFYNCKNLTFDNGSVEITYNGNETSFSYMFYGCEKLYNAKIDAGNSLIADISNMFANCGKNGIFSVELNNIDTKKLTSTSNISNVFTDTPNVILKMKGWKLYNSSAKILYTLFNSMGGSALEGAGEYDLSTWDTSEVTDLYRTFYQGGTNIKTLNLSNWDTSNVYRIYQTFNSCTYLNTLNITGWDCGKITTLTTGFSSCSELENIIGGFNNLGKAFTGSTTKTLNLSTCPLTRESALNVLNGLYDLNTTSYTGVAKIDFSTTTMGLLTDDDIAIGTNKGWTIA